MMQNYENHHIQELPLSAPFFRNKVVRFLAENGLRLEAVDAYYVIQNADGEILAGAGLCADLIKCVAVSAAARQEGLLAPLISRLIAEASAKGYHCLKLFTKPEYCPLFKSLGFRLLASAPKAILMENGRGLEQYCAYLRSKALPGRSGVIVMNANPFTLGHQYLVSKALEQVDTLYLIPVREDLSRFPYAERLAMIQAASAGLVTVMPGPDLASQVILLEGSSYQISAATFPTYFLKDLSDAAETQMRLDIDLFARWIAPALGNPIRFVGSEPTDALTARYNALMRESLHRVVEIPRLEYVSARPTAEEDYFSGLYPKNQFPSALSTPTHADASPAVMPGADRASHALSASAVRTALDAGSLATAAGMCPESTWPYLLADLAERALRMELELPMKPGLVGPDSQGAHKDMDYALMGRGIAAIRPFFAKMAMAKDAEELRELGIEAEKAMMAATGGVNTHRGAIFCLGLAVYAWAQGAQNETLMRSSIGEIAGRIYGKSQTINNLPPRAAMANALGGYEELFEDWLPFYRNLKGDATSLLSPNETGRALQSDNPLAGSHSVLPGDGLPPVLPSEARESHLLRLLLRIMSTLEDTCVVKRVGTERASQVKQEARTLFQEMTGQSDAHLPGPRPKEIIFRDGARKTHFLRTSQTSPSQMLCTAPSGHLKELCNRYAAEGISPGGAADMLALTIFIDSILS